MKKYGFMVVSMQGQERETIFINDNVVYTVK